MSTSVRDLTLRDVNNRFGLTPNQISFWSILLNLEKSQKWLKWIYLFDSIDLINIFIYRLNQVNRPCRLNQVKWLTWHLVASTVHFSRNFFFTTLFVFSWNPKSSKPSISSQWTKHNVYIYHTSNGGCRREEKSCKHWSPLSSVTMIFFTC